jgi:adenylate cyclase
MSDPDRPGLFEELKRRRVVRAVLVYGVVAWVVVQVADVFFPALRLPEWTVTLVAALAVLGFPITVALAWIFERTPDGLRRDTGAEVAPRTRTAGSTWVTPQFLSAVGLGMVLGLVVVGAGSWLRGGGSTATVTDEANEPIPSVAVLPFSDLSPDGDQQHLSDGLTEDILTRLARVEELKVTSRTSVMRYRGTRQSMREIGAELGVAHVVEGSVQRAGDRVRITAQLIDAATDQHLWADSWDRSLEDIFAIQSEIASEIARALEVRLGSDAARADGTTIEAYELYLRGRERMQGMATSSAEEASVYGGALALFEEAIAADSTYAPAWASAAIALIQAPRQDETLARDSALVLARRAMALDPRSDLAHIAIGRTHLGRGEFDSALQRFQDALALVPNSAEAWGAIGEVLDRQGRYAEAWRAFRRASELDPGNWEWEDGLSRALSSLQMWEEAEPHLRRAFVDLLPWPGRLHCELAGMAADRRDADAARRHIATALEAEHGPFIMQCASYIHETLGELDVARDFLRRAIEIEPETESAAIHRDWLVILDAALDGASAHEEALGSLEERMRQQLAERLRHGHPLWTLAEIHALRGDADETASLLRTLLDRYGSAQVPSARYLERLRPGLVGHPAVAAVYAERDRRVEQMRREVRSELERGAGQAIHSMRRRGRKVSPAHGNPHDHATGAGLTHTGTSIILML